LEKLLARLERRFGRHAPEGITLWIVGISGALHLLVFARPDVLRLISLNPRAVLSGEVWRVFTFLFAPVGPLDMWGLIFTGFWLLLLYTMGTSLEAQWGSLRFDLFFFTGALGTVAIGFLFGPVTGKYVAEALLLAFAVEFPDYEILLFILPVKVKYLNAERRPDGLPVRQRRSRHPRRDRGRGPGRLHLLRRDPRGALAWAQRAAPQGRAHRLRSGAAQNPRLRPLRAQQRRRSQPRVSRLRLPGALRRQAHRVLHRARARPLTGRACASVSSRATAAASPRK